MNTKPTWEDVPGILAQILEIMKASGPVAVTPQTTAANAAKQDAAPTAPETDREALRARILEVNRANPDRRTDVRAIVARHTPNGDGKFDDVPDARLPELWARISEVVNVAA